MVFHFIYDIIISALKLIFIHFVYEFVKIVYKNFIRKRLNLSKRYGIGSWVIVTGATDGIGKEYCKQFSQLGFNIILVSRTQLKLTAVAEELKQLNPTILTHTIEFDFQKKTTVDEYEKTFSNLQNKFDISILVNNVGILNRGFFKDYSIEYVRDVINVNILSQAMMTKVLINKMLARKTKSAIINLSSFGCTFPMVLSSVYSSSKIFNDYLSRAIEAENKETNLDLLSVRPLYVATPMTGLKPTALTTITPAECVSGSLNSLGQDSITYGHWKHDFEQLLLNYLPESFKNNTRLKTAQIKIKSQ